MAYRRLRWVESETPLSAANFNNIEDGIEEALVKASTLASTIRDGIMSAADKIKLNGIASGATKNTNASIIDLVYPVGSVYMGTSPTNPAQIFGQGTWVAWGSGRVPVGVNTNDTSFNTVEKTGGVKDSVVPYHKHDFTGNALGTHTHAFTGNALGTHTHAFTGNALDTHTHSFTGNALGSHKHTYSRADSTSGSTTLSLGQIPEHTHSYSKAATETGSTALTAAQMPAHSHDAQSLDGNLGVFIGPDRGTYGTPDYQLSPAGSASAKGFSGFATTNSSGSGQGHTHSIAITTNVSTGRAGGGSGHTHSIGRSSADSGSTNIGTPSGSNSSVSAGTPSGSNSSVSAGTPSGSNSSVSAGTPSGSISYAGTNGNASNANLQPYITCYMWKRTA